jgi:hypothetical protein
MPARSLYGNARPGIQYAMGLFCCLWVFLFYYFRRSWSREDSPGGVWALILGSLAAIARFFLGVFVVPGGFGFSRWLSGFVDIVGVPVLLPLTVYLLATVLKLIKGTPDFANFTLLWLIPAGAIRAVGWSAGNNPVLLVLVPLLWTAQACGIPFFMKFLDTPKIPVLVLAALGMAAVPVLAATAYWAFFVQETLLGCGLFALVMAPLVLSVLQGILKQRRG